MGDRKDTVVRDRHIHALYRCIIPFNKYFKHTIIFHDYTIAEMSLGSKFIQVADYLSGVSGQLIIA